MKNYFRIVIVIGILFVLGLAVFTAISFSNFAAPSIDNDTVVVLNDIAMDAAEDMNSVKSSDYGVEYVVIDNSGNILADGRKDKSEKITVESAIKNRYPYKYIVRDNHIEGTVIIVDNGMEGFRHLRMTIIIALAAAGVLIIAGVFAYGIYVRNNIVRPFSKMEEFAGKVAEGNLNEPLMMEKNNMFGVFSESFDIMREELNASKQREIALQKKEKELVASLSHDLKTPVTGIKLTTELMKAKLEAKGDDSDMHEKLDNIWKKADQIDVLVTDLFTSTLDDLGEVKISMEDVPSTVLKEIIAKYDDKEKVREDKLPAVIIHTDPKRMSQVIGNVIHNSYKYADTAIDVDYKVVEKNLEMRIKDHGPGVPADEIELITNKFYRGKDQKNEEGSGLGLYIAKTLMEKMGGDLIPESDGDGLSITLIIPLS